MVNQYYLGDPGRAHRYINTGNPSSAWLKKEFYLDFIFLCTGTRHPGCQKGLFIPTNSLHRDDFHLENLGKSFLLSLDQFQNQSWGFGPNVTCDHWINCFTTTWVWWFSLIISRGYNGSVGALQIDMSCSRVEHHRFQNISICWNL